MKKIWHAIGFYDRVVTFYGLGGREVCACNGGADKVTTSAAHFLAFMAHRADG